MWAGCLGAGAVAVGLAATKGEDGPAVDRELFELVNRGAGPGADAGFAAITELGSFYASGAAAGTLFAMGRRGPAVRALGAAGTTWLLLQGLKRVANRPRPADEDPDGIRLLIARPAGSSWPSSHPAVLTSFTRVGARELGIGRLGPGGARGPRSVGGRLARRPRRALSERCPERALAGPRGRPGVAAVAAFLRLRPAAVTLAPMPAIIGAVGWPVIDRFRFGSTFAISPHGLFIAIGFMVGAWLFGKLALRRGISNDAINSVVFWSLIGAIVGARVGYVIAHVSEFSSPVQWLMIWKGGISLLGGIAGATIANAINIRRFGLRFFQVADVLAAPLALGIAIGRIGDLIIGDHLGKPTSWLLAWRYEGGTLAPPFGCDGRICTADLQGNHLEIIRRGSAELRNGVDVISQGVGVHQTAMYDMLLAWILFGILWWFIREPRREGLATLAVHDLLRVLPAARGLPPHR